MKRKSRSAARSRRAARRHLFGDRDRGSVSPAIRSPADRWTNAASERKIGQARRGLSAASVAIAASIPPNKCLREYSAIVRQKPAVSRRVQQQPGLSRVNNVQGSGTQTDRLPGPGLVGSDLELPVLRRASRAERDLVLARRQIDFLAVGDLRPDAGLPSTRREPPA